MFFNRWFRKRREREEQAAKLAAEAEMQEIRHEQIKAWGGRIREAGQDAEKILACGPPPDGAASYYGRGEYLLPVRNHTPYQIYEYVQQWERLRYELLSEYEQGDTLKALEALSEYGRSRFPYVPTPEYVFGQGADRGHVQGLYSSKLAELAAEIRREPDPERAEKLFMVYYGLRPESGGKQDEWILLHNIFGDADPLRVTLPKDWDDMVARFIQTPCLADFRKQSGMLGEVEVLQLATQALTQRSLTKAKLALAYVPVEVTYSGSRHERGHSYYPFREALGDQRVAELSLLVEVLHAELGLFAAK